MRQLCISVAIAAMAFVIWTLFGSVPLPHVGR